MKIAILGRTRMLLRTAHMLAGRGHRIVFVGTTKPAEFYDVGYEDFARLAASVGAQYRQEGGINDPDYVAALRESGAEIGVSVNWPAVIHEAAIGAFRFGILNAHAGDLPRYRGNACPNWAILNGEEKVGLCVHFMEPGGLDTGPVLLRDYYDLDDDTYIGNVYEWLYAAVPDLFSRAIEGIEDGSIRPVPQPSDPALSLRCHPRRPDDGRIDWGMTSEQIHRLVRASSSPFAGAFTALEGERIVRIWAATPYETPPFLAVPGQVLGSAADDPIVACGRGALRLTDVAFDDGSPAKAAIAGRSRQRLI